MYTKQKTDFTEDFKKYLKPEEFKNKKYYPKPVDKKVIYDIKKDLLLVGQDGKWVPLCTAPGKTTKK